MQNDTERARRRDPTSSLGERKPECILPINAADKRPASVRP
jgi:hypothetical protein